MDAEKETQPEVPKWLSRRVGIILIKMKHPLPKAEHFLFQKGGGPKIQG